jgi:hypothetical protein
MKSKIDMAHDYAMLHMMMDRYKDVDDLEMIQWANDYADKMQAEEDKRKVSSVPEAIKNSVTIYQVPQKDFTFNFDFVADQENWQPDWSQAPDGYNRFVVGSDHGIGFFTDIEPELIDQEYFYVGHNAKVVDNHNYQGDWRNSLRKRP